MARMTVHIRSAHEGSFSMGWSEKHALVIDRAEADGGAGFGFNGRQLLLLAVGASYANDLFREAEKRELQLVGVRVIVECDWGGDPVRAENIQLSTRVEAEADDDEIMELIQHVDRIAEVHNSLRQGTPVTLAEAEAVSMQIEARSR